MSSDMCYGFAREDLTQNPCFFIFFSPPISFSALLPSFLSVFFFPMVLIACWFFTPKVLNLSRLQCFQLSGDSILDLLTDSPEATRLVELPVGMVAEGVLGGERAGGEAWGWFWWGENHSKPHFPVCFFNFIFWGGCHHNMVLSLFDFCF